MIVDLSAIALDAPVKWEKVTLAPSQRKAFAKGAAKLRFGEELPFDSELLLQPRRVEDQKVDLWHTFNVVQENLIKGGINYIAHDDEGNSRFAQSRAIKAIDSDVKINTSLWTLAKEYAQ